MKFKNKQKKMVVENPPPPVEMITKDQLQEHRKNLQTQLVEAQTKTTMLQGALQMVDLQIQEMNNPPEQKLENKNGVN